MSQRPGPLGAACFENVSCCSNHFGRVDFKHSQLADQIRANSSKHFEGGVEQRLSDLNSDMVFGHGLRS